MSIITKKENEPAFKEMLNVVKSNDLPNGRPLVIKDLKYLSKKSEKKENKND